MSLLLIFQAYKIFVIIAILKERQISFINR
jgi:hypothetical protein